MPVKVDVLSKLAQILLKSSLFKKTGVRQDLRPGIPDQAGHDPFYYFFFLPQIIPITKPNTISTEAIKMISSSVSVIISPLRYY